MKRLIATILTALLLVGAAYGATLLEFSFSSVTNSSTASLGSTYKDFACQVTGRTGNGNIVVALQGSISPSIANDLTWVDLMNTVAVNATSAATDNSSWHFQNLSAYSSTIRMHVTSGADVANTVTGICKLGGR